VLVSTYHGAIYEVDFPLYLTAGIGIFLYLSHYLCPDALFGPAIEASGNRLPGAIAFRYVSPRSASLVYPDHAIDNGAMVFRWSSYTLFLWGQQRL